jgi:hypothetical protein
VANLQIFIKTKKKTRAKKKKIENRKSYNQMDKNSSNTNSIEINLQVWVNPAPLAFIHFWIRPLDHGERKNPPKNQQQKARWEKMHFF